VIHPGAHKGTGFARALGNFQRSLENLLEEATKSEVTILLEFTAGQATVLGGSIEELARLAGGPLAPEKVGICLDTCHLFAAGYDIRTERGVAALTAEIEKTLGLDRVGLIHANDSANPLGSKIDRHADIGAGKIGRAGFTRFLTNPFLISVPVILETPKKGVGDEENLKRLRKAARILHRRR